MKKSFKKFIKKFLSYLLAVIVIGAIAFSELGSRGMLGFYHPQNVPKEGQIRVACVGDSLTHGYTVRDWKDNNYPARLAKMLGDGYCVNNYGNTGHTVSPEGNKPYTSKKLYQQSLDFQPDIVIILLGSNDSKPQNWKGKEYFKEEYTKIIKSYLELDSHPKVYMATPTQVFYINGKIKYSLDADLIDGEIKEASIEIANELGLDIIDINGAFRDDRDLFSLDGAHPNAEGTKVFAQTVYNAVFSK